MDPNKLNRIIDIIREQMSVGTGGYTSSGDQTKAGFDPVMGLIRRKKYANLGKGSRKRWMKDKPSQ